MSIDPTSGPIPAARHENSGSSENLRSESQGSATGSKDGQFSSFWDRALSGAQKLFSKASLFDSERSEESASQERDAKPRENAQSSGDTATLSVVPGFASSGIHRFSSVFAPNIRRDAPENKALELGVSESASRREPREVAEDIANRSPGTQERLIENPVSDEEEKSAQARSANTPHGVMKAETVRNKNLLPADIQRVTDPVDEVGINSAKHPVDMPSKLQSPNTSIVAGPASEDVERPIIAAAELNDGHPKSRSESLSFDLAKARKSLSTALDSAQSPRGSSAGQASQGIASPSSQAASQPSQTDLTSVKNLELESGSTRGSEEKSSRNESRSSSVPMSRSDAQRGNGQAPVSGESTTVEMNAPKRSAESIESHLNRAFKGAEASSKAANAGPQTPSSQNASKKIGGVANANIRSEASRPTGLGSQLRIGEKMDGDVAKAGEFSIKASRSKGESFQGLSVGESPSTPKARLSSFIKPQQSGYASKSMSETKQVYETLAKSVDRLVAGKSDSISLKINFDGGGMLNLRVSMESGRVSSMMQTDLSGLESMIKASWTELSNEMNQKGIKLNAPQFSNSDSQGNRDSASFDSSNREANADGGGSKDSKKNGSGDPLSSNHHQPSLPEDPTENSQGSKDVDPDLLIEEQELKTYA